MADIDRIIEELLRERQLRESAAFSSRVYGDQPLIERGSAFRARMERQQGEVEHRGLENERRATQSHVPPAREHDRQDSQLWSRSSQPTTRDARLSQPSRATIPFEYQQTPERRARVALPPLLRELRALEGAGIPQAMAYGSSRSATLFLRQARLAEHYDDDYDFAGSFSQYYPTYASMSNEQLRGYFAWRTKLRAGQVEPASLSFAFVYAYELLCGVGTVPGRQGLEDLTSFGRAYAEVSDYDGVRLQSYLRRWCHDYAIYHQIDEALESTTPNPVGMQVLVLLRAEHALLTRQGGAPRIASQAHETAGEPSHAELLHALGSVASYHLDESRLAKDEPVLVADVASDVFAALVAHCAARRKTDFVEGLFGYGGVTPYTMYAGAVFCEEERHPDATVQVGPIDTYVCRDGRWRHQRAVVATERNKELGVILHAIDYELRQQLDYAYPLKQRKVPPKFIRRIVQKAIAARLEERAEKERRRISIDMSKLRGIRAAALVTQDALLTDEERGEEGVPALGGASVSSVEVSPKTGRQEQQDSQPWTQPAASGELLAGVADDTPPLVTGDGHTVSAVMPVADTRPTSPSESQALGESEATGESQGLLGALEMRVLHALLEGQPATSVLGPGDPFVSVVADTINEAFFDVVGDAVIEFDGDEPQLVEDYREDIMEVLQA